MNEKIFESEATFIYKRFHHGIYRKSYVGLMYDYFIEDIAFSQEEWKKLIEKLKSGDKVKITIEKVDTTYPNSTQM